MAGLGAPITHAPVGKGPVRKGEVIHVLYMFTHALERRSVQRAALMRDYARATTPVRLRPCHHARGRTSTASAVSHVLWRPTASLVGAQNVHVARGERVWWAHKTCTFARAAALRAPAGELSLLLSLVCARARPRRAHPRACGARREGRERGGRQKRGTRPSPRCGFRATLHAQGPGAGRGEKGENGGGQKRRPAR